METLQSDLIIDASGNGSLTLEFLRATGRRVPGERRIGVNMRYASALFDRVDIRDNYKVAYTFPNAPEESRGGVIMPAENETYQVVLVGRGDDIPPISESEFRRYAQKFWTPTLYNAIKNAKLLTDITPPIAFLSLKLRCSPEFTLFNMHGDITWKTHSLMAT